MRYQRAFSHVTRPSTAILLVLVTSGCRIEMAAPSGNGPPSCTDGPAGELWVYTSMYQHVIDELTPHLEAALPHVKVRWYQAGSEKVASRLEAELAAGITQADVLMTSDPFLYERFKRERRWLPYASPNGLRTPRELVDLDGAYTACRLSTMVLVHREDVAQPPESFEDLTSERFKGEIALGDPLSSGTAFTWAVFLERRYGPEYFQKLRDNGARVAGGNAAVLQKIESGEAKVGVMLLENALAARARGSRIAHRYPSEGAVLVPGYLAIFKSSRNVPAAKAFYDFVLSRQAQEVIVRGDMHAVDPRLPGPRGERGLSELVGASQRWDESMLKRGVTDGARVKAAFSRAFSR